MMGDGEWTYKDKLMSPMWFQRRLLTLSRDNYTCAKCGWQDTGGMKRITDPDHLEVHHLYYTRDLQPWQYPEEALITLCDRCHASTHGKKQGWL